MKIKVLPALLRTRGLSVRALSQAAEIDESALGGLLKGSAGIGPTRAARIVTALRRLGFAESEVEATGLLQVCVRAGKRAVAAS